MSFLNVKVANANSVLVGDTAIILGKSGFATAFGSIPLLCTKKEYVSGDQQISLTVRGLNEVVDLNFNQHVLATSNSGYFASHREFMDFFLKGEDLLHIPVKQNSEKLRNFPGYINEGSDQVTLNIATYYLNNNTIRVDSSNSAVINDLLEPPMFVRLHQLIDTRFTNNNFIFIEGLNETIINEYDIEGQGLMSKTVTLQGRCDDVGFIRVYKDGIELSSSSYTLNPNNTLTILNLVSSDTFLRVEQDHYTVPVVEMGDNLAIQFANTYAVANVSYDPTSPTYNTAMTSNQIFMIQLFYPLTANIGGLLATNITTDIEGEVTEINGDVANISYNSEIYPGKINLANNNVYTIITNGIYEPVFFGGAVKVIENAPIGLNSIKAVSVNPLGYTSPTVTKSVYIRPIPIQRVTDLDVIESLYIDKTKGVLSRATVSFTHVLNQEITDYEISYKISGGNQFLINGTTDLDSLVSLETFSTVKVAASGVDSSGKIIYHINQLGSKITDSGVSLTVRVTPLNKNIRGATAEKVISLEGKTSPPQNVSSFSIGQNENTIVLVWKLPRDSDGVLVDLDLAGVEIRRRNGLRTQDEYDLIYENAEFVASVSSEQSVAIIPITSFETYTYLIKTIDTSGNKSISTKGYTFTPSVPNTIDVYQSYSEDDPATPLVTGVLNTNSTEDDWPSANTALNGNSNAISIGFSELSPDVDFSDLSADGDAYYYTKIRDLGNNYTARVTVDWVGDIESGYTYTDFKANLSDEVSDEVSNTAIFVASHSSNVLIDSTSNGGLGIGDALIYTYGANANNYAYDRYINKTLTNASITSVTVSRNHTGKVLAIFNPGQFAGDGANANSFALIAGVINANAIALGQAYYANSVPIKDTNGLLAWQMGANTAITNALPNVSAASYQIVDLQQFSDPNGSVRYLGGADIITTNVIIRYANSDPFEGMSAAAIANGVCNTNVFYGANTVVQVSADGANAILRDGFGIHSAIERNFRYFQVGLEAQNLDPSQGSFLLDQFRYQVYLSEKTINISEADFDAAPKIINFAEYQSESFVSKPSVKITPISATVPIIAQLSFVNTNNCALNLFYVANGAVANVSDGYKFSLTAEGI